MEQEGWNSVVPAAWVPTTTCLDEIPPSMIHAHSGVWEDGWVIGKNIVF